MRTIAYVDGFNLYFGALRKTAHRWLHQAGCVVLTDKKCARKKGKPSSQCVSM